MQLIKSYKIALLASGLILFYFIFVNLGFYFDITKKAIKSDIIICLGGGKGERLSKTILLYKNGYSKTNKIIITSKYKKSIENKKKIIFENNIPMHNIITLDTLSNTFEELIFAKKIMIANNYKSITIVSTNPHSKRISLIINNFLNFNKYDITYNLVGSNPTWWNKSTYYKNKKAIFFIIRESFKIIYNHLYYTLDNIFYFEKDTVNFIDKIKKRLFSIIISFEKIV